MESSPRLVNTEKAISAQQAPPWKLTSEARRALREILFAAPVLLAFLTATLFTFGWGYMFEYFRFFGVDLYSLDLPVYDFLIASLWQLPRSLSFIMGILESIGLVGVLVIFASIIFSRFEVRVLAARIYQNVVIWRPEPQAPPPEPIQLPDLGVSLLRWALTGFFLLLGVCIIFLLGAGVDQLGRNKAKAFFESPDLKSVLTFKREVAPRVDKQFVELNKSGALRLLIQTKDIVAVFVKRECDPRGPHTSIIPTTNLILIQNEVLNSTANKGPEQR